MKQSNLISIVLLIVLITVVGVLIGVVVARGAIESADPEKTPLANAIYPPVVESPEHAKRMESKEMASNANTHATSYVGPLRGAPVTMPEDPVILSAEVAPEDETKTALRYVGRFSVCGYDTCEQCCGKNNGVTASGTIATVGRTVAANTMDFPFGTILYIDGIGERVVEDRGNLSCGVLDVLCNSHAECYAITGAYDVYVVEDVE